MFVSSFAFVGFIVAQTRRLIRDKITISFFCKPPAAAARPPRKRGADGRAAVRKRRRKMKKAVLAVFYIPI